MSTPGGPVAGASLSAADEDALMRLFEAWERLVEDEDILPPLSPLASRLLAVEHEDAQAITELTQIVESDPVLTGRILGLANSVTVRARSKPIFEVVGAVIRLGVNAVFEAAFAQIAALWMRQSSQLPDPTQLHDLWLEYLITAFCARQIAESSRGQQRQAVDGLRSRAAARRGYAGPELRAPRAGVASGARGLRLRHAAV